MSLQILRRFRRAVPLRNRRTFPSFEQSHCAPECWHTLERMLVAARLGEAVQSSAAWPYALADLRTR
jgi:hypothetical protein